MEMNYAEIKYRAKDEGIKVDELLALSSTNDPFYVGSKGQVEKAKWIAEIYEKMGSPSECHIRRMHYWLVSQKPKYDKPRGAEIRADLKVQFESKEIDAKTFNEGIDKTYYMNTENDWGYITLAAKYARYLGLISNSSIVDRRNPEPKINARYWQDEIPSEEKENIDADEIIEAVADKFLCFNPANTQAYMLELWCEKSTMNDILEPLAQSLGANLVCGLGELSITAVYRLMRRIGGADKPVRIFYISDFDPAGECMPVSVARKIEFFMREIGSEQDVKLRQIMLTSDQCKAFELPRTPIKATERRKEGFEDRHGTGATELDALEAIHPGELKKLISRELEPYFDEDAWQEARRLNADVRAKVNAFLQGKIGDVLEDLDLTEFDSPNLSKGEETDDSGLDWIYDSDDDYDDQLARYKKFKGQES